jgi:murein DD-endopeptidase MepM/ murein hydrolase activator NlpD
MQVTPNCKDKPACQLLNNFGDPRGSRTHQGTDIMGYYKWYEDGLTPNQEVYAVVDGTLSNKVVDGTSSAVLSGNSWHVNDDNSDAYYMYGHLARFAPGLDNGSHVVKGQIIGYVGDTGDSGRGNFHLHFEVHPTGARNGVVDPVPLLNIPTGCILYK